MNECLGLIIRKVRVMMKCKHLSQCQKFQLGSYGINPCLPRLKILGILCVKVPRPRVAHVTRTLGNVDAQDNQISKIMSLLGLGNDPEFLQCKCNCKIAWDVEERNLQECLNLEAAVVELLLLVVVQVVPVPQVPDAVQAVQNKTTRQSQDNLKNLAR